MKPSKNLKNLEQALAQAAKEKNQAKRGVKIAAIIAEALRTIGQDPILVGGAAVEFYTEGGYATRDIDMVSPGGKPLWDVMQSLGFKRKGKDFINTSLEIYIEFPGEILGNNRTSDLLDIDGRHLKIISIEDLIIDRLCSYKFWKSEIDGIAALLLLEINTINNDRLKIQAQNNNCLDALEWMQKIYEEIFRKKMNKTSASQLLHQWLYPK